MTPTERAITLAQRVAERWLRRCLPLIPPRPQRPPIVVCRSSLRLTRVLAQAPWGRPPGRPRIHKIDADQAYALLAQGLSLRAVGRALGVAHGTVAQALNGRCPPRPERIARVPIERPPKPLRFGVRCRSSLRLAGVLARASRNRPNNPRPPRWQPPEPPALAFGDLIEQEAAIYGRSEADE